jgi:hypothetical protein
MAKVVWWVQAGPAEDELDEALSNRWMMSNAEVEEDTDGQVYAQRRQAAFEYAASLQSRNPGSWVKLGYRWF